MSGSDTNKPQVKHEEMFVDRLRQLKPGPLAMLRRSAGNVIAEAPALTLMVFYQVLPFELRGSYSEEIYFLVATLLPLNKHYLTGDFGVTMKRVRSTSSPSVDRRMAILLDSEFDKIDGFRDGGGEMAYRLRQCVRMADGKKIGVDWLQLLLDLYWWSHPEKRIRKKWAASYFGDAPTDTSEGSAQLEINE